MWEGGDHEPFFSGGGGGHESSGGRGGIEFVGNRARIFGRGMRYEPATTGGIRGEGHESLMRGQERGGLRYGKEPKKGMNKQGHWHRLGERKKEKPGSGKESWANGV